VVGPEVDYGCNLQEVSSNSRLPGVLCKHVMTRISAESRIALNGLGGKF
jgi:hypothetical protein